MHRRTAPNQLPLILLAKQGDDPHCRFTKGPAFGLYFECDFHFVPESVVGKINCGGLFKQPIGIHLLLQNAPYMISPLKSLIFALSTFTETRSHRLEWLPVFNRHYGPWFPCLAALFARSHYVSLIGPILSSNTTSHSEVGASASVLGKNICNQKFCPTLIVGKATKSGFGPILKHGK